MTKQEIRELRSRIVIEFKDFVNQPIPDIASAYQMKKGMTIIQFFFINEVEIMKKESLFISANRKTADIAIKVLPIAKVLSAGKPSSGDEEDQLKPGDFVKVNDSHVAVLNNDEFTEWLDNDLKNSNAVKTTKEPDATLNNFFRTYKSKFFNMDPFSPHVYDKSLMTTFKVHDVDLVKVNNLDLIFEHYEKVMAENEN